MHPEIKVLDHGFVRLIETWGNGEAGVPEAGIIEAARQSTQGAFRGWDFVDEKGNSDPKLLATLFNNKPPHSTPFEFCGMVIEVQAPIFVFREWQRHRTQSYNEMSARYAPLPDLNYLPTVERLMINASTSNKQAGTIKGSLDMNESTANWFQTQLLMEYEAQESLYQTALRRGVPKELARIVLPVGRYSKMRASTNLRNWLAFLTLRMDTGAQWEIREYANAVASIIAEQFPRVWSLFEAARKPDSPEAKE